MRNKKTWLIIKGVLILLFTIFIFTMPTEDSFRKWLRFGMLTLFVISFIFDVNNFKNSKK
jgi:hypothetical protein